MLEAAVCHSRAVSVLLQGQGVWQDWGTQEEVAYELPEDNWDTRCGGPAVKFLI